MKTELPMNYQRLEAAMRSPEEVYYDELHERYHDWQATPSRETAAKNLARRTKLKSVQCPCGESFSAEVRNA